MTKKLRYARAALFLLVFFVFQISYFVFSASAAEKSARAQVRRQFHESWRFYHWRIEEGDSLQDLEYILERIMKKYAGAPVNHTKVERELKAVRALKAAVVQEREGEIGNLDQITSHPDGSDGSQFPKAEILRLSPQKTAR